MNGITRKNLDQDIYAVGEFFFQNFGNSGMNYQSRFIGI